MDVPQGVHESAIGIAGHVTSTPGLGGRLKVRIEDFQVDEVAPRPVQDPAGRFVAARLQLVNWETNAFVREASNRLGLSRKKVHFSGTKDKRGVTERWFTFEADPADVAGLSTLGGCQVLECYRTPKELELGQHTSNRFKVVLRNVDAAPGKAQRMVDATWRAVQELGGLPNHFGPQRFGARRATTHKVGERIVRGDFEGAVLVYLAEPGPHDDELTRFWRSRLRDERDWKAALAAVPPDASFERALLHTMVDRKDAIAALSALPVNLQRLFVNAYQSWLFNRILSARIEAKVPHARAVIGDRVAAVEDGRPEEDTVPVTVHNLERVAEEAARGRAVVTGWLPGTEAPHAEGRMGDIETGILREERLQRRDFLIPEKLEWSSRGTRRALNLRPAGFGAVAAEDDLHPGKSRIDFEFELPPGCYATAVLREFMKSPRLDDYG